MIVKAYTEPRLVVHGTVEEITLRRKKGRKHKRRRRRRPGGTTGGTTGGSVDPRS